MVQCLLQFESRNDFTDSTTACGLGLRSCNELSAIPKPLELLGHHNLNDLNVLLVLQHSNFANPYDPDNI